MTTPNPNPSPTPPRPRRLLLWLGCAVSLFFFVLLVIGVGMYWMVRQPSETGRERVAGSRLPPEWRERLREEKDPPEEARRLAPARTDSGNAAELLYRPTGTRGRNASVIRLMRGYAQDASDSTAIRDAARDTSLDRGLRAARLRSYSVVALMLADTARETRMFWVRIPPMATTPLGTGRMMDGLILRGWDRIRRGQRAAGTADIRAAIGIGLMLHEREPSTYGAVRGARAVEQAARLLAASAPRGDTALAAPALRLADWAQRRQQALRNASMVMFVEPDSALPAVTDTTLPFPVRAHALYLGSLATVRVNPWRAFKGPSDAVWRRARAYEQHSDPDFAALGLALDSALTRIERVGRFRRTRLLLRGL